MSLKDGKKKMSKSDPSDQSRINMTDTADIIQKKIQRARTDSLPFPEDDTELKGELKVVVIHKVKCGKGNPKML